MLRDKSGNKLWRSVKVRVIFPENIFADKVIIEHAGPRQGFSQDNIDDMLMKIVDHLEVLHPYWEFRMQELLSEHRTARYLLTFASYRALTPTNQPKEIPDEDSTTPKAETTEDITLTVIKEAVGTTLQDLSPRVCVDHE